MLLREKSAINCQSYPIINNLFSTHQNTRRAICYNDLRSKYAADGRYRGAVIFLMEDAVTRFCDRQRANDVEMGTGSNGQVAEVVQTSRL